MDPEDARRFAAALAIDIGAEFPPGWGWLMVEDDGKNYLVIEPTELYPVLPPDGWVIWLSKALADGKILKGAVVFGDGDSPRDVEARAWMVLSHLRAHELRQASRWN